MPNIRETGENPNSRYTRYTLRYKGAELNIYIPQHGYESLDRQSQMVMVFYQYQNTLQCCPWLLLPTSTRQEKFYPILGNEYKYSTELTYYRMHGFLDPAEGAFAYTTYDDTLTDMEYLAGTSGDRELLELQLYIQAALLPSRQSYIEIEVRKINKAIKREVELYQDEDLLKLVEWLSVQEEPIRRIFMEGRTPKKGEVAEKLLPSEPGYEADSERDSPRR